MDTTRPNEWGKGKVIGLVIGSCVVLLSLSAVVYAQKMQTNTQAVDPAQGNVAVHHASSPFVTAEEDFRNWDPFMEMERLQESMNDMFVDSLKRLHAAPGTQGYPGSMNVFEPELDFKETADAYILKMDIPGMEKNQLSLEVTDNMLTVSGERAQTTEEAADNDQYYYRERSFGSFARSIPLPQNADPEQVSAAYEKGILTVTIKKLEPEKTGAQARKIQVQ